MGLVLAFAPAADLLVLDEPTSGLDPLLQREFAALVTEARGRGATVLLSSHVMAEVEQMATHVALMREGRIAVVDDIAAITTRARRRGSGGAALERGRRRGCVGCSTRTTGVSDVAVDDGAVTFACAGDVDDLVKALARRHAAIASTSRTPTSRTRSSRRTTGRPGSRRSR